MADPYSVAASIAISAAMSAASSALAPPIEGPRLGDLSVSTASYGQPIPRCWGTVRCQGNLIWTSGIKEEKDQSKGGKGVFQKSNSYTYSASFAYAFAAGPAVAILKLWADSKLIYDATSTDGSPTVTPGANLRIHLGDEAQLPDPTIEQHEGVGRVPAHRGVVYVVAENAPLQPWGNRIPSVSALIAFQGETTSAATNLALLAEDGTTSELAGGGPAGVNIAWDFDRRVTYRQTESDGGGAVGIGVYDQATMREVRRASLGEMLAGTASALVPMGGNIEAMAAAGHNGALYYMSGFPEYPVRVDPATMKVTGTFGNGSNLTSLRAHSDSGMLAQGMAATKAMGTGQELLVFWNQFAGPMVLVAGGGASPGGPATGALTYQWGAYDDPASFTYATSGASSQFSCLWGRRHVEGGCDLWVLNGPEAGGAAYHNLDVWRWSTQPGVGVGRVRSIAAGDFWAGSSGHVRLVRAEWDTGNDALLLFLAQPEWDDPGADLIANHLDAQFVGPYRAVALDGDTGETLWSRPLDQLPRAGAGGAWIVNNTFGWMTATGRGRIMDTRTGEVIFDGPVPDAGGGGGAEQWDGLRSLLFQETGVSAQGLYQRLSLNRAQGAPAPLSDVVAEVCRSCGLAAEDVDASALAGDSVLGFRGNQTSGRDLLQQLQTVYFFDAAESDDRLRFVKRGGAPVASIPYADLLPGKAAGGDDGDAPALPLKLGAADELPRRILVRHPDPAQDQQTGTQHYGRAQAPQIVGIVDSVGDTTLDTNVVLDAAGAKGAAKRNLLVRWAERESLDGCGLSSAWLRLEPTDVVTLATPAGDLLRVRLEQVDVGQDYTLQVRGTVEDAAGISNAEAPGASGGFGFQPAAMLGGASGAPMLILPDLPLLRPEDDTGGTALRVYLAAGPLAATGYGGASVYRTTDGATWTPLSALPTAAAYGRAVAALPDHPAEITDRTNSLTVAMVAGASRVVGATEAQVLGGANAAVLIGAGGAEVLQFRDATDNGDGTVTLSTLLRGRRGSEWATGGHAAGDVFALLEPGPWQAATLPLSALGIAEQVRAAVLGTPFALLPTEGHAWTGEAERPWSPVHVAGARDGSNNLALSWVRRSRIGGEWSDGTEAVALGEAVEAYEVDVLGPGGAVLRTIAVSAPAAAYSAAAQIADGLAPGAPVAVRVYQMSAAVGRGHPAEATV